MDIEALGSEDLNSLKCSRCTLWLSKFPVYVTDEHEHICGNCMVPSEKSTMNLPFHAIAKYMLFPCRYKNMGCRQKKLPKEVNGHEVQCEYRLTICPLKSFLNCTWNGSKLNVLEHCYGVHNELFFEQGQFELSLNINEDLITYNLIDYNSLLFIVVHKFNSIEGFLSICIFNNETDKSLELDQLFWTVELKTKDHLLLIHTSSYNMEQQVRIHRDSLKDPDLNFTIFGSISLSNSCSNNRTEKAIDYNLLAKLECDVCKNYALPPIWTDSTNELLMCANCATDPSELTRNLNLESVAHLLDYPCENKKNGCGLVAKPQVMLNHLCYFPTLDCPIGDSTVCSWSGPNEKLKIHVEYLHSDSIVKGFAEISVKVEKEIVADVDKKTLFKFGSIADASSPLKKRYFVTTFSNKLFRVIYVETAENFMWSVATIGVYIEEFFYELEIINKTYREKKLKMQMPCEKMIKKDDEPSFLSVTKKEISSFLTNKEITFKINVFK